MIIYVLVNLLCIVGIVYFITGITERLISKRLLKEQLKMLDCSGYEFVSADGKDDKTC